MRTAMFIGATFSFHHKITVTLFRLLLPAQLTRAIKLHPSLPDLEVKLQQPVDNDSAVIQVDTLYQVLGRLPRVTTKK